jgi:hypothetical protein
VISPLGSSDKFALHSDYLGIICSGCFYIRLGMQKQGQTQIRPDREVASRRGCGKIVGSPLLQRNTPMAYTIWSKTFGSRTWVFFGMDLDSEKLASQSFEMYRLAPGESLQLRDPDGIVLDERIDTTRPHDPMAGRAG